MSAVCIIPARGGSKRIPRKNIKLFHGKPIIAYSIEAARASGLFERIIVSTDDVEIEGLGVENHIEVHRRYADNGDAGTNEVTAQVLRSWMIDAEYVCCVYPCAPLMDRIDLAVGFAALYRTRSAFAYAVNTSGVDTGWYYWGHKWAFTSGLQIGDSESDACLTIDDRRAIDINTMEDWTRAEQMYATLMEVA